MKDIINFLEANVNGKTLYTKELIYKLEDGALQGVYSDQISFSNLKYSQSGFQLDMFIVSNEKYGLWDRMDNGKNCERILALFHYFALNWHNVKAPMLLQAVFDSYLLLGNR